jgi:hypothetical protein
VGVTPARGGSFTAVHPLQLGGRTRGVLLAGQTIAPGAAVYSVGALAGAVIGTVIGLRWMSERATRYVFSAILLLLFYGKQRRGAHFLRFRSTL